MYSTLPFKGLGKIRLNREMNTFIQEGSINELNAKVKTLMMLKKYLYLKHILLF